MNISIDKLPRTSSATIKRLKKIGIETYEDLLQYFPTRYEKLEVTSTIDKVQPGETVTVRGIIQTIQTNYTKRGFKIQKAVLADVTGKVDLIWYNQTYLTRLLVAGTDLSVSGKAERFGNKMTIKPVEYEIMTTNQEDTIHTGRLVPVYPQVYGLSAKTIREKINYVIKNYAIDHDFEYLPETFVKQFGLIKEKDALCEIHFPKDKKEVEEAKKRIAFDELFLKMLSARLVREEWRKDQISIPFKYDTSIQKKVQLFIKELPFKLTGAQQRTIDEVIVDMQKKHAMNRFVQGDVGSGKTVVAAVAAYISHLNKLQTLIMAPTEILAQQHYKTLSSLFNNSSIKIALHTHSNATFTKKTNDASSHHIIIGTQALLSEHISFGNVGLVVVDEQHRFGVRQRAVLKQKGFNPHLLTMTATPIPRTVSLTLYSELDLSVIDEMPAGRLPIKTYVVPMSKRDDGYKWIKNKIQDDKEQVYIICPLIEESESETMSTVKAATKEYEYLKNDVFKDYNVALLHGKMKGKEKDEIMSRYKNREFDILVSTSVVEVGIDVPNATVMIIEGSERFGLAQLHQLRGRVGRSDKQSYCFLFTSTVEDQEKKRLQYFAKTTSGMKLAEYDLKLRGPGELYGTRQHGYDELKIADLTDTTLVHLVQNAVTSFIETYTLDKTPELKSKIERYQIKQISRD